MSDERWNTEASENQFTGGPSGTEDKNIIDSTAEVIGETETRTSLTVQRK